MLKMKSSFVPSPDKLTKLLDESKTLDGRALGSLLKPDQSMASFKNTLQNTASKTTLKSRHHSVSHTKNDVFDLTEPFLPEIKMKYDRNVVSGRGIDEIYTTKEESMLNLKDEMEKLRKENTGIKNVNEKLLDQLDLANNIIQKQADAGTYWYNCPPKAADASLKVEKQKATSDKKDDN